MPYLKIQTNRNIGKEQRSVLLKKASQTVGEALGKPESYVMVALESGAPMLFAGSDTPVAYLEVKSIGLPDTKTAALSEALSALLEDELDIGRDRIYIEFTDALRSMWGWNGGTF